MKYHFLLQVKIFFFFNLSYYFWDIISITVFTLTNYLVPLLFALVFCTCPDLLLFPIFIIVINIITIIASTTIFINFLIFCFVFVFLLYFCLNNSFPHIRLRFVNFFVFSVPKRFTVLLSYCYFKITLYFNLRFTIFLPFIVFPIYINRSYGSYHWVECLYFVYYFWNSKGLQNWKFYFNR